MLSSHATSNFSSALQRQISIMSFPILVAFYVVRDLQSIVAPWQVAFLAWPADVSSRSTVGNYKLPTLLLRLRTRSDQTVVLNRYSRSKLFWFFIQACVHEFYEILCKDLLFLLVPWVSFELFRSISLCFSRVDFESNLSPSFELLSNLSFYHLDPFLSGTVRS